MGKKSDWLALGYWTVPDPTEKYGREWKGWKPVGNPPRIKGRPGGQELPPIADPSAKATLPRTRLDEMLARQQLTDSEYALALLFQENPCGPSVLNGYYAIVVGIILDDKPAEALADPRVGRSKGIDEVMRKLRLGLRLMRDHYLPEDSEPDEVEPEGYGAPKWRGRMAQQLWSANMRRASSIKQAGRAMPKTRRKMMVDGAGDRK